MSTMMLRCLQWGCDVYDGALMRPRNDEHIMTPSSRFESLRMAYNSKKPAKMKGKGESGL
jgi:hypothetical protein